MNINFINKIILYFLYLIPLSYSLNNKNKQQHNNIILEKNNFVEITDIINEKNTHSIINDLSQLSNKTNNLIIYINSQGGSVIEGEKIINQINFYKNLNYIIHCIALNAYSMAFYIFQSCSKRYITDISKLMTHQIILSTPKMQLENLINYLYVIKKIDDNLVNMVIEKIDINKDEYIKKRQNDWWIYGDDIIKYKLADEIIYINLNITMPVFANDIYSIKYF
jgi:ATP-dependent protease ClpP protease subunit